MGNFYRHLAIFSGHAGPVARAGHCRVGNLALKCSRRKGIQFGIQFVFLLTTLQLKCQQRQRRCLKCYVSLGKDQVGSRTTYID